LEGAFCQLVTPYVSGESVTVINAGRRGARELLPIALTIARR
jgi:hypothetical protein